MKNFSGVTTMNWFSHMTEQKSLFTTNHENETMNDKAETLNGRAAMIGFIAAIGAYMTTGQIIPGIW